MTRLLEITYVKSGIGGLPNQRRTLEALGLRRLRQKVRLPDNPSVRGMVDTVNHLVRFEEIEEGVQQ